MTRVETTHLNKSSAANDSSEAAVLSQIGYGANGMCQETQGAEESPELAPASLCLLFPVFRGLFRRLISQANRLC